MNSGHTQAGTKRYSFLSCAFICSAVVIVGYYLLAEHRAHTFAALPWLLILACPLMHLFMGHGGHNANHDSDNHNSRKNASTVQRQHG